MKETYQYLEALREVMRSKNVDAVIITNTDPHQSEYISDHWKLLEYLTGFTGDNATAVVTLDKAGLWTDSRFFLQGEIELKDSGFDLHKENIPGELTREQWLAQELEEDSIIAIDGNLFSLVQANQLENFCGQNGFMLATDFHPADVIWPERPERPASPAFVHDEALAGENVESKINRVLQVVTANDADCLLVTALDEIAWLLNLRGSDVMFTPVVIAYAFISERDRVLFIDEGKVTSEVKEHLKKYHVKIKGYDDVERYLEKVSERMTIMLDPNRVSDRLGQAMLCNKTYMASPVEALKAVKNAVQIAGFKAAGEREAVALIRTFMWVEAHASDGITELDVEKKAIEERSKFTEYRGDSFHMIAGYKEHGAIVHYQATEQSASALAPEGLLLIDTGGQYIDGTTDMTRTFTLGNPTEQERHDFTLVLKAHLGLARAIFPAGTLGVQLDVLAHGELWKEGQNYRHGTGHGVGHFLGCHEGPHQIRMNYIPAELQLGMNVTDEPGIYKAGRYGIRTENMLQVVSAFESEEFGPFYRFEPMTYVPYDTRLIDRTMLNTEEIAQVNSYHAMVRERISPLLEPSEQAWLTERTKEI